MVNARRFDFSIAGYFVVALSFWIYSSLKEGATNAGISTLMLITITVFVIAFLHAAIANIILEAFNGKGSALGLFNILGTCGYVFALLIPLAVLSPIMGPLQWLANLAYYVILIWYVAFAAKMVGKYYNVNALIAWISVLSITSLPLTIFTLLFAVLIAVFALIIV